MNKEEINKLIIESNVLITTVTNGYQVWMPENIEKFAELVAAAEREACAKVAEQIEREIFNAVGDPRVSEFKPKIATAIRARGQG